MIGTMDAVDALERAYDDLATVVAALGGEQYSLRTCCPAWDVRGLLNHILGGALMYTLVNAGERAGEDAGDVVGTDPTGALEVTAAANPGVVARAGRPRRRSQLPLGHLPRRRRSAHQPR